MIPKCSNLVYGMSLGDVLLFWSSKVIDQGHRVTKLTSHTRTLLEPRFIGIRWVPLPVVCGFADA